MTHIVLKECENILALKLFLYEVYFQALRVFCSKLYLYLCVGTLALLGPFYELGLGGQGGFVPVTLRGIWGGVKVSIVHIVVQKIFNWKYDYFHIYYIPLCNLSLLNLTVWNR